MQSLKHLCQIIDNLSIRRYPKELVEIYLASQRIKFLTYIDRSATARTSSSVDSPYYFV